MNTETVKLNVHDSVSLKIVTFSLITLAIMFGIGFIEYAIMKNYLHSKKIN